MQLTMHHRIILLFKAVWVGEIDCRLQLALDSVGLVLLIILSVATNAVPFSLSMLTMLASPLDITLRKVFVKVLPELQSAPRTGLC